MKKIAAIIVILAFMFLQSGYHNLYSQIMIGSTEVDTHSVVTGLDTPWEILWGPDNYIWLTERRGNVSLYSSKAKATDYKTDRLFFKLMENKKKINLFLLLNHCSIVPKITA